LFGRHEDDMQTKTTAGLEIDEVRSWRCEQLCASGFAPKLAAEVAGDPRYDLHELIQLVERGCPAELAVRILAPLV
jgi:hypothetical protein